jgi:tetratricopeptide (TPR) repeat protein
LHNREQQQQHVLHSGELGRGAAEFQERSSSGRQCELNMVRRSGSRLPIAAATVALVLAAMLFVYRQHTLVERAQEDVAYFFNPTPERAFEYGLKHFDATVPQEYDIVRAQYFFSEALKKSSDFPLAHYELARIAFLQSEFPLALDLVDQEFTSNPKPPPYVYYVRALIEGYMTDYADAEKDYETYFKITPANWAGINDYSWVLLKDDLPEGAHAALSWGLKQWPNNAWLLSNDATALYELGRYSEAAAMAKKAVPAVNALTEADWLVAYPGNDPQIARQGLDNFKTTTQENLTKILAKANH